MFIIFKDQFPLVTKAIKIRFFKKLYKNKLKMQKIMIFFKLNILKLIKLFIFSEMRGLAYLLILCKYFN